MKTNPVVHRATRIHFVLNGHNFTFLVEQHYNLLHNTFFFLYCWCFTVAVARNITIYLGFFFINSVQRGIQVKIQIYCSPFSTLFSRFF